MTGRRSFAAGVLIALFSGGCGTVDNIRRPVHPPANAPSAQVCRVYGGVRGDWDVMSQYPWHNTPSSVDYVAVPLMMGIDLFFTFVGDTVTLPYTVGAAVWRGFTQPDAAPAPLPVTGPAPDPPSVLEGPAGPSTP